MSVLFGDGDTWRRQAGGGAPSAGWNTDPDWDDSGWDTVLNGAASGGGGITIPDGRALLTVGADTVGWRGLNALNTTNYARGIFVLPSLGTNMLLSVFVDNGRRVWVNGELVFDQFNAGGGVFGTEIDVTAFTVAGPNLVAVLHETGGDAGGVVGEAAFAVLITGNVEQAWQINRMRLG